MTALDALTPTPSQLAGIAALVAVAAGFCAIGRWISGERRGIEGELVYGWAAVATLFTVVGAVRVVPFGWIALAALGLAAIAVAVQLRRPQPPVDPALIRIAVIALPLILLVGAMTPSQWDEFTNWLPNARYLVEHGAFPAPDLPKNPSVFPAYPYGLPLVAYLASRIAGHLVENAIALFNLLLLLSLGLCVARAVRQTLAGPAASVDDDRRLGWGWCGFGALAVTALNPTFVSKVVFTAYADTATAVALGFAAYQGWRLLDALAARDDRSARLRAWGIGLAGTALILTKQANGILIAGLVLSLALIAWRDPALPLRGLLRQTLPALALPVTVYAIWRAYVALNMTGGEFPVPPVSAWLFGLIPDVIAGMATVAAKKGGYFGIMLVAVVLGIGALLRPGSRFGRLAVIAGGLFLCHNAALLVAYIAVFGAYEATHVASYWRYNMHLGGVCVLFAAVGGALLWRRYLLARVRVPLGWAAVALAVAMPVAMAGKLRFDLHPRYVYAREVAAGIAPLLTPSDRLVLLDLEDDGQYIVVMRYGLYGSSPPVREITAFAGASVESLRKTIGLDAPSHLWLYRPLPVIAEALGTGALPAGSSHLLKREGESWVPVQAWPHPAQR